MIRLGLQIQAAVLFPDPLPVRLPSFVQIDPVPEETNATASEKIITVWRWWMDDN